MKSINAIVKKMTERMMFKYEKASEKAEVFNRSNYPRKTELLKNKLTEEYKLWSLKRAKYPHRFNEVEKDIKTLKEIMSKREMSSTDRATVDRLCYKYSVI